MNNKTKLRCNFVRLIGEVCEVYSLPNMVINAANDAVGACCSGSHLKERKECVLLEIYKSACVL
jgi:hypothetical protein